MKKFYSKLSFFKGFTLPELMISIAIIGIIVTIVTYNHKQFNSNLELTNVAYRVAVSIREAQVYGISVKEFTEAGGSRFDVPYGINFSTSDWEAKKSYVFFGDSNPNPSNYPNMYDGPYSNGCNGGTTDECLERIILGRGNIIKKVCAVEGIQPNPTAIVCLMRYDPFNNPSWNHLHGLSITFKRPKSDAIFTFSKFNAPVVLSPSPNFNEAFICLEATESSRRKKVVVSSSGQISVRDLDPGFDSCNFE